MRYIFILVLTSMLASAAQAQRADFRTAEWDGFANAWGPDSLRALFLPQVGNRNGFGYYNFATADTSTLSYRYQDTQGRDTLSLELLKMRGRWVTHSRYTTRYNAAGQITGTNFAGYRNGASQPWTGYRTRSFFDAYKRLTQNDFYGFDSAGLGYYLSNRNLYYYPRLDSVQDYDSAVTYYGSGIGQPITRQQRMVDVQWLRSPRSNNPPDSGRTTQLYIGGTWVNNSRTRTRTVTPQGPYAGEIYNRTDAYAFSRWQPNQRSRNLTQGLRNTSVYERYNTNTARWDTTSKQLNINDTAARVTSGWYTSYTNRVPSSYYISQYRTFLRGRALARTINYEGFNLNTPLTPTTKTEFFDFTTATRPQVGGLLYLYPNPARGRVSLQLPPSAAQAEIRLHDATGKACRRYAPGTVMLDVQGLAPGLYHIRTGTLAAPLVIE